MSKRGLSEQDLITRKVSLQLNIPEDIIEKVMSFEKKSIREATHKYNTIEISGLGVLSVRNKKVLQELENLEGIKNTFLKKLENTKNEEHFERVSKRLEATIENIEFLKRKLDNEDKSKADVGGLEESVDSPERIEGDNREDAGGKAE